MFLMLVVPHNRDDDVVYEHRQSEHARSRGKSVFVQLRVVCGPRHHGRGHVYAPAVRLDDDEKEQVQHRQSSCGVEQQNRFDDTWCYFRTVSSELR